MERRYSDFDDPVLTVLVALQAEGAADLINKPVMPLERLTGYDEASVAAYNADYFASEEQLRTIDALVCDYATGKIGLQTLYGVFDCLHYGGHTGGDFMVFLIRDQLGPDAAIGACGDILRFVRTYNSAAELAGKYRFSDAFVAYVEAACSRQERASKRRDVQGSASRPFI